MSIGWTFEGVHKMGGALGTAYTDALQGRLPPQELLAREVIQNSCDAKSPTSNSKVKVVFRQILITGDDKRKFLAVFGTQRDFKPRLKNLGIDNSNCLTELSDPEKPLKLLIVEDWNTIGLEGHPHDDRSHFHRLLFSIGDDSKAISVQSSGGSFGFGKSVLSSNSRIRTIVAYSAFDPSKERNNVSARLMGCAFFHKHEYQNTRFTGRAWLGKPRKSGIVDPFEDEEAHDLAERFKFSSRRGEDKRGTSILIVDSEIDFRELTKSIEDYWWPLLCDEGLDVELWEDGKQLDSPRPKMRKELRPFIECYDLATGRSQPTGKHQKIHKFNRFKGVLLGTLGFQVLEHGQAEGAENREFHGCVALIRVPRMVVWNEQFGRPSPPAVGVFVASEDIDQDLKLSEPSTHDRWDPTSNRLMRRGEESRERVKTTIQRIKQKFREFQAEVLPPPPKAEQKLNFLERLLGNMFRPPAKGTPPPIPALSAPVHISFVETPKVIPSNGNVATAASFQLSLREDVEEESLPLRMKVYVPILEEENTVDGDPLSLTLTSDLNPAPIYAAESAIVDLDLHQNDKRIFNLVTSAYDPNWSTRIHIEVTERKDSGNEPE